MCAIEVLGKVKGDGEEWNGERKQDADDNQGRQGDADDQLTYSDEEDADRRAPFGATCRLSTRVQHLQRMQAMRRTIKSYAERRIRGRNGAGRVWTADAALSSASTTHPIIAENTQKKRGACSTPRGGPDNAHKRCACIGAWWRWVEWVATVAESREGSSASKTAPDFAIRDFSECSVAPLTEHAEA